MALPNGNFLCHTVDGFLNGHGVWILNRQGEMEKTVLSIPEKYPFRRCGWNTMALQADGRIQIYDAPVGVFYLFDPKDESIKKVLRHKSNFKMTGDFVGQELNSIINESYADGGWVLNGIDIFFLFGVCLKRTIYIIHYMIKRRRSRKLVISLNWMCLECFLFIFGDLQIFLILGYLMLATNTWKCVSRRNVMNCI